MGRLVRILVWAIILFAFYFFFTSLVRNCGSEAKADSEEILYDESFFDDADNINSENGDDEFEGEEDSYTDTGKGESEANTEDSVEDYISTESDDLTEQSNTASVKTDPIPEPAPQKVQEKPINTKPSNRSGQYMVIVGSFLMKKNAEKRKNELVKKGYTDSEIVVFEASQYFTVISGRYLTHSDATAAANQLKSRKIDCYVKRKS